MVMWKMYNAWPGFLEMVCWLNQMEKHVDNVKVLIWKEFVTVVIAVQGVTGLKCHQSETFKIQFENI